MTPTHTPYDELARRLLAEAYAGKHTSVEQAREIESLFERLEAAISALVGTIGFRAVATRAMHLTRASHPWLSPPRSTAIAKREELSLMRGMAEIIEREGAAVAEEAAITFLGKIISLLADFIGADLTLRLVRRATPPSELEPGPSSQEESDK